MKLSQIIKEERDPQRNKNVARLYLENGWYRAYELSAYLIRFYPNSVEEEKKLKPTHKFVNEVNDSVISVGLKLSSMDKFLPKAKYEMKDGFIDVTIEQPPFVNTDDCDKLLTEWKESVPVSKPTTVGKVYSKPFSMTDIVKEIMSLRIENCTDDELRDFVYNIKEKCYSLI